MRLKEYNQLCLVDMNALFFRKLTNFKVKFNYLAPGFILFVLVCQEAVQEPRTTQDFMSILVNVH